MLKADIIGYLVRSFCIDYQELPEEEEVLPLELEHLFIGLGIFIAGLFISSFAFALEQTISRKQTNK